MKFSLVVPVYNRPEELDELLESLKGQVYNAPFEVVVVEDGSQRDSASVVQAYASHLDIQYFTKPNTGPGDSRNYGMRKASGDYFLLVDSDCILPPDYLQIVRDALLADPADCFGGRDAGHPSFSPIQQAISFTMTSPLTTGGIRGRKKAQRNFQPRSFNMGLSRRAFEASGGFGSIHPGEDPDLSLRLLQAGFQLKYIPEAVVFHKRRIDFKSFYRQVKKFGMTRPILNRWHPGTARITYWFPTLFCAGLLFALLLPLFWQHPLSWAPLAFAGAYLLALFFAAWATYGSVYIALLSLPAALIQFAGYGWGFLKSTSLLTFSGKKPQELFPGLFFKA
ncbi:glycosyltransferase [Robiginitalea aestuariiviva]|uniref:glycosyltransferase n=1 Tax=Robiginitalea aestuariiviva TaxID=3036903 RepID=UPI0030C6BA39